MKKIVLTSLCTALCAAATFGAKEKEVDFRGRGENTLPQWIDVNRQAEMLLDFHRAYTSTGDIVLREVACLRAQYKNLACAWQPGDLFAGRIEYPALAVTPQSQQGYIYCFSESAMNAIIKNSELSDKNRKALSAIIPFWKEENTVKKTVDAYPEELKKAIMANDKSESGIASPMYRISGSQLDYDKLCRLGVDGLKKEIGRYMKTNRDEKAQTLYKGMLSALDIFSETVLYYASMIETQKKSETDPVQLKNMERIISSLKSIAVKKPANLHQAIQLCFIYSRLAGSINYGRMDEYLGDFYAADLKSGKITRDEAVDMLVSLFKIIESQKDVMNIRAIVGGKGRRNEANADQMALVVMDAANKYHSIVPQMTLRFCKDQNPALYTRALDIISAGYPYPLLYNDDVNIPAVQAAQNIPESEAANYLPFGCGEYMIYHKSISTPSGMINLLQALTVTLHNGVAPLTGKPLGLALGKAEDFKTFDQLMAAYKKQVEYFVTCIAQQQGIEYRVAAENAPILMFSILYDDCIARGKPLLDGGVRYLDGTLESYGNTNTADALTAIKKVVYEDKALSLTELVDILDKNFEGYAKERNLLLNAPKFGNDDDYADAMRVEVDRHINEFTRSQANKNGMHSYLIVIINNQGNTQLGLRTAASADGRPARTYMANANAPTGGADKNGVTALLNSMVKPDKNHAGAVQNLALSKELFAENRPQVEALLNGYWRQGGAQIMMNVVGRDDLLNAMEHPENYANLIVRVGGFCARFVELPRDVQLEILSRTLY